MVTAQVIDTAPNRNEAARGVLSIRALSKYFGGFCAVNDISLDIHDGEFLTLLGSSGSGKSTTLYMIAGFEQPSAGEIELAGRSLLRVPPHKRNIGMVFQRYSLFPHMSVRENIAFPLSVRKVAKPQIRQRVEELLRLVQLTEFAERKPTQLSGGQQQRVALARALAYEPKILLMDEPLGALDKRLREEIQNQLRRLHERLDVTIIYVTHDQEEALRLSDRIAVFSHGEIVQVGTGRELYEQPRTAFVGAFIGNSNFLRARVDTASDGELGVRTPGDASLRLRASGHYGVQPGAEVMMMVRPEKMHLATEAEASGYNAMPVTVTEKVYLGDNMVYEVRTAGGESLRVKQADSPSAPRGFEPGQRVRVQWRPQDTRVFTEWNEGDIRMAQDPD